MFKSIKVSADDKGIGEIANFVRENMEKRGVEGKELQRTTLAMEESARALAVHTEAGSKITVRMEILLGRVSVEMFSNGEEFRINENIQGAPYPDDEDNDSLQDFVNGIFLSSMADKIMYRHIGKRNIIFITERFKKITFLFMTIGAMILAVLLGLILSKSASPEFNAALNSNFLIPVRTMYMNALKMVVAPVVFFSIVSCIVRFSNISELGRIGGRIIFFYFITTLIAIFVGLGMFYIFRPGSPLPAGFDMESAEAITSQPVDISIVKMIVGIVPSDIIKPFMESNMLQLIFLAIITGLATGMIGRYSDTVKNMFEAFNDLFLRITTFIINCMPVAVFCSICTMMITTGLETIVSILGTFATFLLGLLCMMLMYCLLMIVIGKLNPRYFLKKYTQTMLQVFSMASSNAAIPVNMEACKKLGIEKRIYSLSIPLGATLNMDGACIYMAIFSLALAKSFGVDLGGASIGAMIFTIVVLSFGAPGIPGSGLICLSVLLTQFGVPAEAVGLVMGIDPLLGMFRCMSNCTGDVAASLVVAKRENDLDMEKYKSLEG